MCCVCVCVCYNDVYEYAETTHECGIKNINIKTGEVKGSVMTKNIADNYFVTLNKAAKKAVVLTYFNNCGILAQSLLIISYSKESTAHTGADQYMHKCWIWPE